jgi:hypothetical protein
MSGRLLRRRGTAAEHATFTGAEGEFTYDKSNKRIIAHDGSTMGGIPAAKLSEVVTATRTSISDAAYTVLTTDRIVAYTSISAARTVSLPAASTYPVGAPLWVIDESGSCSGTSTITVARAWSDTIDGATNVVLDVPYAAMCLTSNGLSKWTLISGEPNLSPAMVGINATPDSTNRLSVNSSALLFSNVGNGVQLKVNKNAAADTASFLFQTAFSGRAEIGTTGDNDLHFKVSPDGSNFYDAIQLAASSGIVILPMGQLKFPAIQNPSPDANTLDDYEEGIWTPTLRFGGATTGIIYSIQSGRYTKIGNRVLADIILSLLSKGTATGAATITNLPFTQLASINGSMVPTYYTSMTGLAGHITGYIGASSNICIINQSGTTGVSAVTDVHFTNTTQLQLHLAYFV